MRDWLRSAALLVLAFCGWLAFFHLCNAGSIQPGASSVAGGTDSSHVTASGAKGITVNGTSGTTTTSPFTFSLGPILTFDTMQSNAAQPITFTPATNNIIFTDSAGSNTTTFTPSAGKLKLNVAGVGTFEIDSTDSLTVALLKGNAGAIVVADTTGFTLADDASGSASKFTPSTQRLTLDVTGTGTLQLAANDSYAADLCFITTVNTTTVNATTVNATTVSSTNVTATNVWTNSIGPNVSGPITVKNTLGWFVAEDDGTQGSSFIPSLAQLTLKVPGSGLFQLDASNLFAATTASITTLTSSNVTVTARIFCDVLEPRTGAAALTVRNVQGFAIAGDDGSNASTFTPAAQKLTLDVAGTGVLQLAAGDSYAADLCFLTTINATTATITGNVTIGTLFTNTINPQTGTDITMSPFRLGVSKIFSGPILKILDDNGMQFSDSAETASSISSLVPGTNKLTLGIAGAGTFAMDQTDTFKVTSITGDVAAIEFNETSGIALASDTRTNTSTIVPTAKTLTINVDGTGTLQLAVGDCYAADLCFITTVNATSTISDNVTATAAYVNTIWSRTPALPVSVKDVQGLKLLSDDGVNGTTLNNAVHLSGSGGMVTGDIRRTATAAMQFHDGTIARTFQLDTITDDRNAIINGDMSVDQRKVGGSLTLTANTTVFNVDRWRINIGNGGAGTAQRTAHTVGQTVVPGNPKFFLKWVQSAGGTGNDGLTNQTRVMMSQPIEDVSRTSGETLFLSAWMSTAAATLTVTPVFVQFFGTGGGSNPVVTTGTPVTVSNSFTQTVSQSFTIPSISGKTIGTGGDDCLDLRFIVPVSTTFTLNVSDVLLEETPVDSQRFPRRSFTKELTLCQRYHWKTFPVNVLEAQNTSELGAVASVAVATGVGSFGYSLPYPTTMRIVPTTITSFSTNAADTKWVNGTGNVAFGQQFAGDRFVQVFNNGTAVTGAYYRVQVSADAEINF